MKHKRDKKALTAATEKRTPAGSPSRNSFSPRGGRGGFSGGRGRGGHGGHGGGRGGSGHHNFTNGHQAPSRGKQNYDLGKPSTPAPATALTTNGDTRKDPKAAAPASVEGTADGLSDPTTNASTETPGAADPLGTIGTAPKVCDPPKSAAAPPSRKMPGSTSMSWAQIARWVPHYICISVIKLSQTYTKIYTSPSTRTTSPHTCRSAAIDFICATAISTSTRLGA